MAEFGLSEEDLEQLMKDQPMEDWADYWLVWGDNENPLTHKETALADLVRRINVLTGRLYFFNKGCYPGKYTLFRWGSAMRTSYGIEYPDSPFMFSKIDDALNFSRGLLHGAKLTMSVYHKF